MAAVAFVNIKGYVVAAGLEQRIIIMMIIWPKSLGVCIMVVVVNDKCQLIAGVRYIK